MGNALQPLLLGSSTECEKNIEENRKLRLQRFKDVRAKLATSDKDVEQKRKGIVAMSLEALRKALQSEAISAVDALDAYMWKAMSVNEKTNCVTEFLIEAFDAAKQLDESWRGKNDKPPLYGIPFSVKGSFYIKGYDCCIGLGKFLFQPKSHDCTLVTHLRSLGAVPFVITNVPQALLSFECSNSVYGTTGNPFDPSRTPGGSSGGECALVGSGGSPFGTGSDLAGSLRIPASMCGVVALKPTEARFIVQHAAGGEGKCRMRVGFGFFTRVVEDQAFLLSHIFGNPAYRALIPRLAPIPFDKSRMISAPHKILQIGYVLDDGFLKPVPACMRVVRETAEKLKKAGHKVVEFKIPTPELAASLFYKNLMPDGGESTKRLYANDVVCPYMKNFVTMLSVPFFVRSLASVAVQRYSPQMATLCGSFISSVIDVPSIDDSTEKYVDEFISEFKAQSLDAIVCPAFPVPAVPHEYPSVLGACAFSTALYNMLDFPAGVVPTGRVQAEDDTELMDENIWPTDYNIVLKTVRDAAKGSVGLPLAVQVVTLPFQEEECLAVMDIIQNLWA